MKVTEALKSAIEQLKENKGYTNKQVGELAGVSDTSVRNWLNKEDAVIRQSNYESLVPHIRQYLPEDETVVGIKVTKDLRLFIMNFLFFNPEFLNRLSPKQNNLIGPNNPSVTPLELSEIFAELELNVDEAPLTRYEKSLLFVDKLKKSKFYNEAPIAKQSRLPYDNAMELEFLFVDKAQYIGNFEGDDLIGVEMEDDSLWFKGVLRKDIVIFKPIDSAELEQEDIILIGNSLVDDEDYEERSSVPSIGVYYGRNFAIPEDACYVFGYSETKDLHTLILGKAPKFGDALISKHEIKYKAIGVKQRKYRH